MLSNMPKTRVAIYLVGIAAQIASLFVSVYAPEIGQAFSQAADVLGAVALGTAVTNLTTGGTATQIPYVDTDAQVQMTPESVIELDPVDDGAAPTATGGAPKHAEV